MPNIGVVRARVPLELWGRILLAAEGQSLSAWLRQACAEKIARDELIAARKAREEAAERATAEKRDRFLERTQGR